LEREGMNVWQSWLVIGGVFVVVILVFLLFCAVLGFIEGLMRFCRDCKNAAK
jgi:hypothetical protein